MHHKLHTKAAKALTASLLATALTGALAAEPAAENAEMPAPNPAAEKALQQHFQNLFKAFDGKGALPEASKFSEDFNKQVTREQMTEVFKQVRQSVGACKITASERSPISYVKGYLLDCEKAYVPMEIAVEEKAPYRVHSLLIRPGYWK